VPGTPPDLRRGRNLNNRASGELGEEITRRYLAREGYEIVKSNYRTCRGELDLISRQEDTLVIVEVKLRWIHKVQRAYQDGSINSLESLQASALVDWAAYARIMDLIDFAESDTGFRCRAKLKPQMDEEERPVEFTGDTNAAKFRLEAAQDGLPVQKGVSTDTL
jgi:Holliday junction resolvase-like predicted endonuclease